MTRLHRDERGILISWLARAVIFLGLLGVAVFDAGVIAVNFFRLDGIARETAVELLDLVEDGAVRTSDARVLERTARELVAAEEARVVSVTADEEGAIIVHLRREAPTLVVKRIEFMRDLGRATATARANTP